MAKSGVSKWLRIVLPTVIIAVWLTLGAVGGPYFGKIEEVSEIDLTAFLPNSAEATKVNEEVKKFRDEKTIPAIVVFESKTDLAQEQLDVINQTGQRIGDVEGIDGDVAPAIQSDDKKAAFIVAPVNSGDSIPGVLDGAREVLANTELENVTYKVTGPAGFAADLTKAFAGIDGILLLTALAVVFVILIVVYRSAILPIVVLMTSILALSSSILVVWLLAKEDIVQLNGQVQGILFILVIGAATDYSLLYVSRYREALYRF
ncbi:MAG: efflux RND transporter permease subunit, partial [Candidatus Saccharimonadales bacterium]